MRLYKLGVIPWDETQGIYHALAQNEQEGLVICAPSGRCVCLGLHDDLKQEVNVNYCRKNNIGIIRRELGGGLVLLESGQIFFQLILKNDNPLLKGKRIDFFTKFLQPVIKTLKGFNIEAKIKKPADLMVNGRKISGNSAGDINGFGVYTGNILLSFDRAAMANVLNLPNLNFAHFTRLSMQRYLTTMAEELGSKSGPDFSEIEESLIANFKSWLGNIKHAPGYSEDLKHMAQAAAKKLTAKDFLELPGKKTKFRQVKVSEGIYLRFHPFKGSNLYSASIWENENSGRFSKDDCLGYVTFIIKNGKIFELDFKETGWLEKDAAKNNLGRFLEGVCWKEADIREAVAKWQMKFNINNQLNTTDILTQLILGR